MEDQYPVGNEDGFLLVTHEEKPLRKDGQPGSLYKNTYNARLKPFALTTAQKDKEDMGEKQEEMLRKVGEFGK